MKILSIVFKTLVLSGILFIQGNVYSQQNGVKKNPSKKSTNNSQPVRSLSGAVERLLNNTERNIINSAEAMPEDKFYFTPEGLDIKGGNFKNVRTYAGQIKHLATDNFDIWRTLTGDPLPDGIVDVNGPANIKTKAEIIKFLKDSFALGHKAIATLTKQNVMEMLSFRDRQLPRLDLAFYALTHANEHYGQMVVYLRMCGIVPPATVAENQ
jgi:DinB superfamily